MPIYPFLEYLPKYDHTVYISPSADLIGWSMLGQDSSLWFNVTVRGDVNYIKIGARTNIQDGSVVHVTTLTNPTIIGDDVTVGHGAILHGCTIGDLCLIGMGAIVMDGAVIEPKSYIAAGALVPPGKVVPTGTLFVGSPGQVKRDLTQAELDFFPVSASNYVALKNLYLQQDSKTKS
ncbi:MAG: gamma carbonic anhydrase family protein [Candidatus Caenarcaniphilales bacterium]|nr:gamma carbonic anhydrase family protein [Candidatus Caenarcaniphilales bacterium]